MVSVSANSASGLLTVESITVDAASGSRSLPMAVELPRHGGERTFLSAADGRSCPAANEQRGWHRQAAMHARQRPDTNVRPLRTRMSALHIPVTFETVSAERPYIRISEVH